MIKRFLRMLQKTGRCKAYVDAFGNVIFLRYYLLGVEPDELEVDLGLAKPRLFPNIWLHHIPQSDHGIDGGNYHTHPWSNLSIILSGGYEEHVPDKEPKWRRAGAIVFRSIKTPHFIGRAIPKTYSLFAHGFRKRGWGFEPSACSSLCDKCAPIGHCYKSQKKFSYKDYQAAIGDKYMPQWVVYDDFGKHKVARRRAAAKRAGKTGLTAKEVEEFVQTKSRIATTE